MAWRSNHHVTSYVEAEQEAPDDYAPYSAGYGRRSHIDRGIGAIHTGMGTCSLRPGGHVDTHVHSFEELVYVIQGSACLTVGGRTVRMKRDEGAFIGVGEPHSWHNDGVERCLWIDLQSPQARSVDDPSPDTFFLAPSLSAVEVPEPVSLDMRDPLLRRFTRWSRAEMDLDALKEPVAVDAPTVSASMSSALLAYSGITVKMLLDERHGAYLCNMFMVDYYPGVVLHPHDHPIEEAFYMLEGEVVFIADGEEHAMSAGDVAYAGVGCVHAFENRTARRCRWLETRAPLPPLHHGYRFERDWASLSKQCPPSPGELADGAQSVK